MSLPNNPITRKEMYLSNMAGQGTALPSEPHTREEEYLDYIARNGGGGGGSGDGDMKKSVYDGDLDVAVAGGIKAYVASAISSKVDKVQGKGLSTNDYDNSAKDIVDGVTTALDGKVSKLVAGGVLGTDGNPISVETPLTLSNGEMGLMFGNIEEGIQTSPPTAGDVYSALALKADKSDVTSKFAASVSLLDDTVGWIGGNLLNDDWFNASSRITVQKDNHSFTLTTDNQDQYASFSFFNSEIISGTSKGALFPAGKYVITLNVTAIGDDTASLAVRRSADSIIKKQVLQLGDNVFNVDTNEDFYISIFPRFEKTTVTTISFNNIMMLTEEQYALNPAYRPYHESVEEYAFPRSEQEVLGARNSLYVPNKTVTDSDVEMVATDGEISITGQNSGSSALWVTFPNASVSKGTFKFRASGLTASGVTHMQLQTASGTVIFGVNYAEPEAIGNISANADNYKLYIRIAAGANLSAAKVFPQLLQPSDDLNVNSPFAMTNRELTEMMATKDVTVTAGTDVTVNSNTHVYSKAGVVTGSLRLEIGATLTAGATIATLSAIPKNTTYAIAIDNTDKSVIPIIIGNNGAVQLFGGFIPTSGNQLLIPIAYATA